MPKQPALFNRTLRRYNYTYPASAVGQVPARPRDSAKLLIYERAIGAARFDIFKNIKKYLPKGSVLVLNQTRVIPARIVAQKETGGAVELLYVSHDRRHVSVLANKPLKPGARLYIKPLSSARREAERGVYFTVIGRSGSLLRLKPSFPIQKLFGMLGRYGITPLPPYLRHSPLSEASRRIEYQAVFARLSGSVAAPTASLHFTNGLLAKLKRSGVSMRYVTLHVNLGTFAPLTESQLKSGRLHSERYTIDKKTARFLNAAKAQGRPIIAVGTTVARTLESAAEIHLPQSLLIKEGGSLSSQRRGVGRGARLQNLSGSTDLFIRNRYRFKFIDGLITNFHVPRSSLLMLVAALVGRKKLFELYAKAIRHKFRLFSFGDAMLII